jgi:hypothetical protein
MLNTMSDIGKSLENIIERWSLEKSHNPTTMHMWIMGVVSCMWIKEVFGSGFEFRFMIFEIYEKLSSGHSTETVKSLLL